MQLVAQWGVLCDGDDRRFAGVAFLALDALFAFFTGLASGANGSLRAGIALWADGTAVALRADRPGVTAHALRTSRSADDETIWSLLPSYRLPQRQLPFAARAAVAGSDGDAFLSRDGRFTAAVGDRSVEIDTRRMRIGGLHNAYNAMAAALAALAAGVAPDRIRRSIYAFAPVEHRLEPVRETDGVLWINDSKATNVDSVWYALESMKRPVVWIAGGTDKGNDYEPLKAFAREKVHTLVCMGVDNRKLVESFTGVVPEVISTASLDEAMEAARRAARPGDAVLLSPACASFDLFRNYEQRGELFKKWVGEHC